MFFWTNTNVRFTFRYVHYSGFLVDPYVQLGAIISDSLVPSYYINKIAQFWTLGKHVTNTLVVGQTIISYYKAKHKITMTGNSKT